MENVKLYKGDCLEKLKGLPDNSVDSIVTDPPYGLSFMGKKWDYDVPSVDIWKECLRVLKPGGHLLSFAGSRTYHRMAVRIEDAGFEIRDQIMWVYGCYSEDTEVLTNKGWKKYKELNDSDKILQWDNKTNQLTWLKPINKFEYDIEDDMVMFKNRHTEQLITKNHSVYAKIRKHSRNQKSFNYERIDAVDIKKNWIIDLPLASNLNEGVKEKNAYIIGWWLTDAWVHNDKKACMFSQSKIETLNKLREELKKQDCCFSEYIKQSKNVNHKDEHTFYVTGNLANFLLTKYPNRDLYFDVLSWDFESRLNLLNGLIDGDGTTRDNSYSEVFWSKKKDRLDVFQALCLSLNIRSHIDYVKGCVYFNRNKNTTQLQSKHKQPLQKYKGKVWCLETETGAFVVRRNGKAFISGNSGFPKSLNIGKAIEKQAGVEMPIGKGFVVAGYTGNKMEKPTPQGEERDKMRFIPKTENGKKYNGWGTALKPAHEPIVMARKPLSEKTVAKNVLKYGTGGINIDECRVGLEGDTKHKEGEKEYNNDIYGKGLYKEFGEKVEGLGRFPANFIHDGSDEVVELLGEPARFFYCAKASKKDRNEGLDDFEEKQSLEYCKQYHEGKKRKEGVTRKNNHPTVKPTKLMQYLVRLVTPKNGIVLDPFMGSGSTGKACMLEDFNFIGIELDEEYYKIAEARINVILQNRNIYI